MLKLKLVDSTGRYFEIQYQGNTNRIWQCIDDFDIVSALYEDGTEVDISELIDIEKNNEDDIYDAIQEMENENGDYNYVYERNDPDNDY